MENLISLGIAAFVVLGIRSTFFEAFKIPSGSMIPSLMVGDFILVNKFSYGLKVPFSDLLLDAPIFITKQTSPARGNVIVFKFPLDPSVYYIKRVIGTPGDTVEVRNQEVFINAQAVQRVPVDGDERERALKDIGQAEYYQKDALRVFNESLPTQEPTGSTHAHWMMQDDSTYGPESFGPIQIPPDHVFVMGDNRDHSNDSRVWGFVPFANIRGRAFVIWFNFFVDFGKQKLEFHPTRMGTMLR